MLLLYDLLKSILQYQVDCEWSGWSAATSCTKTCDTGKHLQTRTILTHERDGGAKCPGENIREMDCNNNSCPPGKFFRITFKLAKQSWREPSKFYYTFLCFKYQVDCKWTEWSTATDCSKTCGIGKQLQTRMISTHEKDGGAACTGANIREKDCNTDDCPRGKFFSIFWLNKHFFVK